MTKQFKDYLLEVQDGTTDADKVPRFHADELEMIATNDGDPTDAPHMLIIKNQCVNVLKAFTIQSAN